MQADGSLVKNDAAFQTSYKGEYPVAVHVIDIHMYHIAWDIKLAESVQAL